VLNGQESAKIHQGHAHLLEAVNHQPSMTIEDFSGSDILHASLADGVKS
jgi:hypothetical protein